MSEPNTLETCFNDSFVQAANSTVNPIQKKTENNYSNETVERSFENIGPRSSISTKKANATIGYSQSEIAEKNIIFVDHKNKTTWVKQEKIKILDMKRLCFLIITFFNI